MLHYSRDRLKPKAERDSIDASVKNGFLFIDEHSDKFLAVAAANVGPEDMNALMRLQRLYRLANRKLFGNKNLYDLGCEHLLKHLTVEGMSKRKPYETAEYLLFLRRQ